MNQQRRVRLVVMMMASLFLLVEITHLLIDEPENFREVYAGAVQMAHPEHRLIDSDATADWISTRLEFVVDRYNRSGTGFFQGSVSMTAARYLSKSLPPDTKMT